MRIILFALAFIAGTLFSIKTDGQVVINEISYNSPESGNDTLEFIELYNAGILAENIGGWHFTAGLEDTFPAFQLQPGAYFVTAISAQAMSNVYGVTVHQWSKGALSNNGEAIILVDTGGNLIDSVLYDDVDPWPTEPDGNGPSLELISADLDNNDGANWQFSGGSTGVIINGFEVKGTPGAENSGGGTAGPAVTISLANFKFTPKNVVIQTGDTVLWVNNDPISHNVNGTQTTFAGNPASFISGNPAAGPWEYKHPFDVTGLYNYRCDVHFGGGMTGTVSVYDPLAYTDFPLPHLRITDGTNGSHLFVGVPTTVTGVVHGINFQPTGYSFYIIDQNNVGINVFSFDPGSYVVTEGDRVKVSGTIAQFNGLLEISPDIIEVLATNQPLVTPTSINDVTESVEGSLVESSVYAIDSIVATGTTGYNVYVTHEDGAKILIRVDGDTGMDLQDIEGSNEVIGIGTQFDSSFPFTSGYQILALGFSIVNRVLTLDPSAIEMKPNPANDIVEFTSDLVISGIEVYSLDGKMLLQQKADYGNVKVNIESLPVGIHIVKAITAEGVWTSRLAVVR
jgi:plastocyanin